MTPAAGGPPPGKSGVRILSFALALASAPLVAWVVFRGGDTHALTFAWLGSIVLFLLATRFHRSKARVPPLEIATLLFVAALPVAVRAVNVERDRLHMDEYLTGFFSAEHDFAGAGFFGYIPEWWEWQGTFPKPFFLLQRVFFGVFGKSISSLHFSALPYVAIVSVMLFLIVREMLDSKSALAAVVLHAFLAPSVYLETLGFMFVSSTAILTVFLYFALKEYRTGGVPHAALAGVACGFCYLTYYSSYLALPILAAVFVVQGLRERSVRVFQNFSIALGGVFVVVAPFVAGFLRAGDYVTRRSAEIGLLKGAWSPYRELLAKGAITPLGALRENLALSLRSFVRDGIGGHGGYDFGRLALLDRFSLVLLLAGVAIGLVLMIRRTELLFVFMAVGAAFVSGMVMTIPPPAYHRFSIAFPFLAILMSLPFFLLFRVGKVPPRVRAAIAVGLLLVFAAVNQRRFIEAVFRDQEYDDLRLANLIDQRYAGRKAYVAAFPSFGFEKILYFRREGEQREVETDFHDALLGRLDPREKYVYVIILADHFREKFEQADPNGRFIRFSTGYSLFVN